ncbi:Gfo/Idh/MocA family oxidoreductase [Aliifodinibius sp. S!AR15-10]|uniref:Gfo/Idh/MocA family oxidoreductase n=1 Tax=Aliifodinibius sp. S!AR15-10 TaxID=2950437 RepID=UPI002859B35D|nr:Gfo/Idh/MocA family oxidoreductase [Aliifodinibius sp. S!AR15-10]MDR8390078.1 Gfo/Idh/MocA family oxidoreductase [Aliifodinibius sp. S!AR15-10]
MDSKKNGNKMSRREYLKTSAMGTAGLFFAPSIVPASVLGPNPPSEKINIGQIGCGRIARGHDLMETMGYDVARVVAACDVDIDRAREGKELIENYYAKEKGKKNYVDVAVYQDYREMLQDPEIDAVIISTPDHWHAQPAIEAALAGKDIYLQKPASLTVEGGRAMSDIIHRTGTVFQIGSQQRSVNPWPQFKRACELVRNGRIGELQSVEVGLPGDPGGGDPTPMPVPKSLDYDMWLGSTPDKPYTEQRVHPEEGYSRPGWLRIEQFSAGMITGWGAHHIDAAHWGMGTEYTGPVEVEATAEFPTDDPNYDGLWNVHGDFKVTAKYDNGVIMTVGGDNKQGVRFVGSEGWIYVSRGDVGVTASDPVSEQKQTESFQASDAKILQSEIGDNEIHLYESEEQHGNWLKCIKSRELTVAPAEVAHRSCSACLISHIAMKLPRKLYWDPVNERFKNDDEANSMLSRSQRAPWGIDHIDGLKL